MRSHAWSNFPLLLAAAPLKHGLSSGISPSPADFPLLLAAAPLKQLVVDLGIVVWTHFPLLLAAAPLKLVTWAARRLDEKEFSAAFSGGPIEAHMSIVP